MAHEKQTDAEESLRLAVKLTSALGGHLASIEHATDYHATLMTPVMRWLLDKSNAKTSGEVGKINVSLSMLSGDIDVNGNIPAQAASALRSMANQLNSFADRVEAIEPLDVLEPLAWLGRDVESGVIIAQSPMFSVTREMTEAYQKDTGKSVTLLSEPLADWKGLQAWLDTACENILSA